MIELKPCKICGKQGAWIIRLDDEGALGIGHPSYMVACTVSDGSLPLLKNCHDMPLIKGGDNAAQVWNKLND